MQVHSVFTPRQLNMTPLFYVFIFQCTVLGIPFITAPTPLGKGSVAALSRPSQGCISNACKCTTRWRLPQGLFCGSCHWHDTVDYVIIEKRNNSHMYECKASGSCCDYGEAEACISYDETATHHFSCGPF